MESTPTVKKKKLTRFKKLRSEILVPVLIIFSVSVLLLIFLSGQTSINSTMKTLDKSTTALVQIVANKVRVQLEDYLFGIETLASSGDIDSELSESEVIRNMRKQADIYGFNYIRRTNAAGIAYESGSNVADRDYFKAAKEGNTYISDLLFTKDTQKHVFMVSAPIMKNGRFDGVVYGAVDSTALSDIIADNIIGKTGGAYILSAAGDTIGSTNQEQVDSNQNIQKMAESDSSLKALAEQEAKMCRGETGSGEYKYNGQKKLLAYAPIEGTNGWSVGITAELSEYLSGTKISMYICLGISLVILLIAALLITRLANAISKPLTAVGKELGEFKKGNFSNNFPYEADDTELGELVGSIIDTKKYLKATINDISSCCTEMANNNFDIKPQVEYIGEFKEIENALVHIVGSLSDTLSQINMAAQQVSSGSDQVSSGAQALAQGATEQASSIEELSIRIMDINTHVTQNAALTDEVNHGALAAGDKIQACNTDMQQLNAAMEEIRASSEKINHIIKTIDDLAFQTNILALNAAVEAARAGEAGKGFAVVADEVRNLATKSAAAAKDTAALIVTSVEAVKNGVGITVSTAQALHDASSDMQEVVAKVDIIAQATVDQAKEISQVTQGIDQISSVVQTNSATSEESAAASEELSGQANMLQGLVSRFHLHSERTDYASASSSADDSSAYIALDSADTENTASPISDKYL